MWTNLVLQFMSQKISRFKKTGLDRKEIKRKILTSRLWGHTVHIHTVHGQQYCTVYTTTRYIHVWYVHCTCNLQWLRNQESDGGASTLVDSCHS